MTTDRKYKLRSGLKNFPDFNINEVNPVLYNEMGVLLFGHWEKNKHMFSELNDITHMRPAKGAVFSFNEFINLDDEIAFMEVDSTLEIIHEKFRHYTYKDRMFAYIRHLMEFNATNAKKFDQIHVEMDKQIAREGQDVVTGYWRMKDYLYTVRDLDRFIYAVANVDQYTYPDSSRDWWEEDYVCPEFAEIVYRILQLVYYDANDFNETIAGTWNIPLVTYFFQLFFPVFNADTVVVPSPAIRLPQFLYCGVEWPLEIPMDLEVGIEDIERAAEDFFLEDIELSFDQERMFMKFIIYHKEDIDKYGLSFFIGNKKQRTGARSKNKNSYGVQALLGEQIQAVIPSLDRWKTACRTQQNDRRNL